MGATWFRRAADLPGLGYAAPQPVDATRLRGYGAEPELSRREDFEGKTVESLHWSYDDGEEPYGTSASPAQNHASAAYELELSSAARLQHLWETLELPGQAGDYHFAIQDTAGDMWRRKRKEPTMLAWAEWLCWLDIRVIRAWPDAVRDEHAADFEDRSEFYGVTAFRTLAQLYKREGFLTEAQQVAEVARSFDQGGPYIDDVEEKLAALRAEDGG